MIQAGDSVLHKPTGETWFILGISQKRNRVCVAGWPPSEAELSDCELVKNGNGITSDELEYRNKQFGTNWD